MCKRIKRLVGFSLIESLITLLLISLIFSMMFSVQLACTRHWQLQEALVDWQENQRLAYWLFQSWLQELQILSEKQFELKIASAEIARSIMLEESDETLPALQTEAPILLAVIDKEVESLWFIDTHQHLFLKHRDQAAQAILSHVEGWQLAVLDLEDNLSSHLLQIQLSWVSPLKQFGSVPFLYHYETHDA